MNEDRRRTIKVVCGIPNGIELRLYGPGYGDGPRRVTGSVVLRGPSTLASGTLAPDGAPVVTEVDAEFWEAWVAQNKEHPPSFIGQVYAEEARRDE